MILNELFADIALISGQWFGPCRNRLILLWPPETVWF